MLTFSENKISRTLWHEGKEYLFFSGTSYLGLSSNEEFHKILKEGIDKYGSNHPMSRISNVRFDIYEHFEKQFAIDFLAEDCISLSSGFLVGKLLIEYFTSLKYNLYISPEAHPALWLSLSLSTNNISHNTWIEQIISKLNLSEGKNNVIFCNSLNSLSGEVYNFDWIDKINDKIKITLVIDDSHGIGVIGKKGKGVIENVEKYASKKNINFLITASLGKALGITGGVILGKVAIISELRKSTYYTSSSPIIPAYLYAYLNAYNLRNKLFKKLRFNINYFNINIENDNFQVNKFFPVVAIESDFIGKLAYQENIILSSFPYPFQNSPLITRIVINSAHNITDLDLLSNFLKIHFSINK
jgi:7-keto-8-aminopelargonate synthetase-like enzyme